MVLLLVSACVPSDGSVVKAGDLEIHGAFAFAPPTPTEAAGYFTVVNRAGTPDTLVSITSTISASAMVHGQVPDGGMVRMQHVDAPVVPAGDSLVLQPGGSHLMLMDLERLPKPGDSISVTLVFSRAGPVALMLPVRAYGDAP
jgi:hypothetical protein